MTTATHHDIFFDGLRNAHAMEKQALSIIQAQLGRLEHYPQMSALLEQHNRETEQQVARLDEILASLDQSSSAIKDTTMSFAGTMSALGHTFADDEILKNSFANYAFEHFEIASYTSLLTLADACNATSAKTMLQESLDEEKRMAAAIHDNLDPVTRQFITLSASSERADI
jgi:ferritin-like metal-binding protein YciE